MTGQIIRHISGNQPPLIRPAAADGPSQHAQALQRNRALKKALHEGLGNEALPLLWNVQQKDGQLVYKILGRNHYICGFYGHKEVCSLLTEENGKIVARFYADRSDAEHNERSLKTVVLNKKTESGQWPVQFKPETLLAAPELRVQHLRLKFSRFNRFLLTNYAPGVVFDLGEQVVCRDRVIISLNGSPVQFGGLAGHKKVWRQAVSLGTEKRMYFWPSEAARQSGAPAIVPQGQLIAQKTGAGWQIVDEDLSCGHKKSIHEANSLGNFAFATVGYRIRVTPWPTRTYFHNGNPYTMISRRIRGKLLSVSTVSSEGINGPAITETREFGGRLKLTMFWLSQKAFAADARPFAARFLTFNTKIAAFPWQYFWHPVDASAGTVSAYKQLVRKGYISYEELSGLLADVNSFLEPHGMSLYNLIDRLISLEGKTYRQRVLTAPATRELTL
jgi:hypothetical protein